MKRCIIQTRVINDDSSMTPLVRLEPLLHKSLYDIPAIKTARGIMVANPEIQMVGVVVGKRYYTIIVLEEVKPEIEKYAFELDTEAAPAASEKADD